MPGMLGWVGFIANICSIAMKSYITLFCLVLIFFFENCCRYLIAIARIPFIDYESPAFSTIAGVAFTALNTVSGVILSLMTPKDVSPSRLFCTLSWSTLAYSILFLATAYSSTVEQVIVIRILMGVAMSIVTPYSVAIIVKSFSETFRGRVLGVYYSATYCAYAFSMWVGTEIYTSHGWKAAYTIFGPIGVAIAVISLLVSSLLDCGVQSEIAAPDLQGYGNLSLSSSHGTINPLNPMSAAQNEEAFKAETGQDLHNNSGIVFNGSISSIPSLQGVCEWLLQYRIGRIFWHWYQHGYVYTAVVATGVRLGAGFVWSNYTSLFFSPLFYSQGTAVGSSCSYSFNASLAAFNGGSAGAVCSAAFPYCVNSVCRALTATPWHNQGMSAHRLVLYMSWVPIAGSVLGNGLGGWLSDWAVQGHGKGQGHGGSSRAGTRYSPATATEGGNTVEVEMRSISNSGNLIVATHSDAGHNNSSLADGADSDINAAPAAGECGGDGTLLGGTTRTPQAVSQRFLICAVGNALAVAPVWGALSLGYPYCFLVQIASGLVAEGYMTQALAVVGDCDLLQMPAELRIPATALFLLLVNNIASAIQYLIPFFRRRVGHDGPVAVHFHAEPEWAGPDEASGGATAGPSEFSVEIKDATHLQYSILAVFMLCYGLSSILFFCAYAQMKYRRTALS